MSEKHDPQRLTALLKGLRKMGRNGFSLAQEAADGIERLQAASPERFRPLTEDQIADMLGIGNPSEEEVALIRKTELAHGITAETATQPESGTGRDYV